MPHPKDHFAWLAILAFWCLSGILAWCSTITSVAAPANPSSLTLLAILVLALTALLRWPLLTPASAEDAETPTSLHAAWWMSTVGLINWLGALVMRCESAGSALVLLSLALGSELVFYQALPRNRLPWITASLQAIRASLYRWLAQDRAERPLPDTPLQTNETNEESPSEEPAGSPAMAEPSGPLPAFAAESSDEIAPPEQFTRKCTDQLTAEGQRYMSGEILIQLEPQQQSETIVIGFCPAFEIPPTIELECEAEEELRAKVINCTTTGMRIAVRRSRSQQALECLLAWYALEAQSNAAAPQSPLP